MFYSVKRSLLLEIKNVTFNQVAFCPNALSSVGFVRLAKFTSEYHTHLPIIAQKNLPIFAVAQSACPQWPISAKILDSSSDHNCWNFFSKKILVRFETNISCLSEGILNILKKTAFSNFSKAFISRFSELLGQVKSKGDLLKQFKFRGTCTTSDPYTRSSENLEI